MKDLIIGSDCLTVHVNPFGAELKSVEQNGAEYLWQGETETYARTSPTLFPIIGRFVSDTYFVGDTFYQMPLNGFAMNRNFSVTEQTENSVRMELAADPRSREIYPFDFHLTVRFTAVKNRLTVQYTVLNEGKTEMPCAVGCHTAYRWPLTDGESPEDCFLRFEKEEELESFNPFGWRSPFVKGNIRPLSHDLFANFTRSITNLRSSWIELGSNKSERAVRIEREQFPFLAIWTMPDQEARFICLEPCTSIHTGGTRLDDRNGIRILCPSGKAEWAFSVEFR